MSTQVTVILSGFTATDETINVDQTDSMHVTGPTVDKKQVMGLPCKYHKIINAISGHDNLKFTFDEKQ